LYVKFWGTRGSTPRAFTHDDILTLLQRLKASGKAGGKTTLDEILTAHSGKHQDVPLGFGGDTTCVEIGHGKQSLFVDMGSGLRQAGTDAMDTGNKEFHILVTHMHWDHVLGLPFFRPIFEKDFTLHIYHVHNESPEFIKLNFNGINFPVLWGDLGSNIVFHQLKPYRSVDINGMKVEPFRLDHPGDSFGYRIEAKSQAVVIGFDSEYTRLSRAELGKDLKYYQNLDLLIFDGQYTPVELEARKGWGHSTPTTGCELALREGIKKLAFTHHDPWADFDKLISMWDEAKAHVKLLMPKFADVWKSQPAGPELVYAYDRLRLNLGE
jgi:phosphoribosyl 1,2-cyclic phosphodiesterase